MLVGFSQGGALIASFLERSELADHAVGAVLDSPLLSLDLTLELQAANRGIPDPLIEPLIAVTGLVSRARSGLSIVAAEHLDDDPDVPVLLFHGTDDTEVPVLVSDLYAAAYPEDVTYVRLEGVGHVRAWNADTEAYGAAIATFLEALPAPTPMP